MNYNKPVNNDRSTIKGTVTGLFALLTAGVIGFVGVLIGESLVYEQTTEPIIDGVLWPVSAGLVIALTIVVSVFILMVALGMYGGIEEPTLFGWSEYTIVGFAGLIGTTLAVLLSLTSWAIDLSIIASIQPDGSGESLLALAAIALPFSYVFYEFYRPSLAPMSAKTGNSHTPDPEFVRDKTAQWSTSENAGEIEGQPTVTHNTETIADQTQQGSNTKNTERGNKQSEQDESNTSNTGYEDFEYRWVNETDVGFDDVGGMEELKDELSRDVIKPLTTHREKAEELGISAPNIIFHGPPGTGKTYVAEALATELELPFAQLSGADVQSKWINESAQKVKTLFEEAETIAKQEGGAVVFLDELDSVLKNRDGSGKSHEEDNKVVNEFLNHLEGTEEHNIVFIGATNRLESLDEAGIRSGRIDKKIHVGKPDVDARAAILKAQLADRPHNLSNDEIHSIAAEASGVVAADIELVVKNSAKRVLVRDGDSIVWDDIKAAVEEVG